MHSCLPSASMIQYIYPIVCTLCFVSVITAPSALFLSSFSVEYSIYLPIAPYDAFLHQGDLCFISRFSLSVDYSTLLPIFACLLFIFYKSIQYVITLHLVIRLVCCVYIITSDFCITIIIW